MNITLIHDLIHELDLVQVEDNNSHDPTLLHDVIKLGLLLLFWLRDP